MVENVVSRSLRRRHFLRLAAAATAAAVTPRALCTEQHDPSAPAAPSVATFDDVWQTVRDRFYDPHLHGLDWTAVRERYIADAARATSDDVLAGVINRMLSELHASHTRYYTPDQPEYLPTRGYLRRRATAAWARTIVPGRADLLSRHRHPLTHRRAEP